MQKALPVYRRFCLFCNCEFGTLKDKDMWCCDGHEDAFKKAQEASKAKIISKPKPKGE